MTQTCQGCGRRQRRRLLEHVTELTAPDHDDYILPEQTPKDLPLIHGLHGAIEGPFSSIRRFPSLSSNSVHASDGSSNILAEKDEPDESNKDVKASTASSDPAQVGFFHPAISKARVEVLLKFSSTLAILCIFILSVLSISWGVLFHVRENLRHATITVVNFDASLPPYQNVEPIVGPFIERAVTAELTSQKYPLGYEFLSPSLFKNDPLAVRLAVHEERYWGAITVNNNATALLRQAVETGNTSYDPFGAAAMITYQARDIEAYNQYITPVLTRLASDISFAFGPSWTTQVLMNDSLAPGNYSNAPQALSPGIGFSIFNLRPFDPPTAIPTVSIGSIYLIILAFFSIGFFIPTLMKLILPDQLDPRPPLSFAHFIIWRYFTTLTAYFFLSLFYSLVTLAFQIPFSRAPLHGISMWSTVDVTNNADHLGRATFAVYWMLNFLGMTALGLACENVGMLVGQPWMALWFIFWVITNVSTAFYALELAPSFYAWGYVWPLRLVVYASRTLLFDTHDRLALNFGILTGWAAMGTALFPGACWVMRWKAVKERRTSVAERRADSRSSHHCE